MNICEGFVNRKPMFVPFSNRFSWSLWISWYSEKEGAHCEHPKECVKLWEETNVKKEWRILRKEACQVMILRYNGLQYVRVESTKLWDKEKHYIIKTFKSLVSCKNYG